MKSARLVLMSLLCVFAFEAYGDWPMVNGGMHRTSWAHEEGELRPPFDETFTYSCDGQMLAVKGDTLYIGRSTGPNSVVAVDLESGLEFWTFEIEGSGASMNSVPAISDSYVFCGGQGGLGLFAVDRFTGEEVWRQEIGSMYSRNPVTDGDRVFVVTDELYCFDAETGATLWTFPASESLTPAVDDSCVYVNTGQLSALDRVTGAVKWSVPSSGGNQTLTIHEGMLFLQEGEAIVARDKSNGDLVWSYEPEDAYIPSFSVGALAVSDRVLCFDIWEDADQRAQLVALETASGEHLWHASFDTIGVYTPTIANDVVYVVEWIPQVLWGFDIDSGDVLLTDASTSYYNQPIAAAHSLLIPGFSTVTRFRNSVPTDGDGDTRIQILLLSAHPNPCMNKASFSFYAPSGGPAELSVLDMAGRGVLTMGLQVVSPGRHALLLPTLDLPAGTYTCRMNVGGCVASHRLVVLR